MNISMLRSGLGLIFLFFALSCTRGPTKNAIGTIALWLFDEPLGTYPSSVLDDSSPNDYPLTLGPGGKIAPGKFGHSLEIIEVPQMSYPNGEARFGLSPLPVPEGLKIPPMTWMNAKFSALMTRGENHLRKEVGYANPTDTKLNLGNFDWTVEFWYLPTRTTQKTGVVFEVGRGPRGENDEVTALLLRRDRAGFEFYNQPADTKIEIKSVKKYLTDVESGWHHYAFAYTEKGGIFRHFVDGKLISTIKNVAVRSLSHGEEAYMSIGRNGIWQNPLPGRVDELRFSLGAVYVHNSNPPASFAIQHFVPKPKSGLPLLFDRANKNNLPIRLGNRKHLFIDGAFFEKLQNIKFVVNPPKTAERVLDKLYKPFRKHLTVVEDEQGLIRIYNSGPKDYLQVFISQDGIHFTAPDVGHGIIEGQKNIVIPESVGGLGNPFIDPNGPPEERWKYISGYHRRGIYVYTSPDGYNWTRHKTALLPFRSGTQSCSFYDDQRGIYVSYHRSGIFHTPAGATQRSSVITETRNLFSPIEFNSLTAREYLELAKQLPLRDPLPWYLDNGPLTPGGFGMEFPHKFDPLPEDPVGTDIYVTKAQKYAWAPDTYLAFPIVYFHYEKDGPPTRQILMDPRRGRGSGPIETQISVSRDGQNWKRYPRQAYVGIGKQLGRNIFTAYIADGMVRRGDEIWQYYFGETQYHSAWKKNKEGQAVYRLVQRLDGFISMDSPYGKEAYAVTKPFIFKGNELVLNIDTDATGYAQVGILDKNGRPLPGFSVDQCVYINGDFIRTKVEWIKNVGSLKNIYRKSKKEFIKKLLGVRISSDVSALEGKTIKLVFRMRGAKLYSMQFTNANH